MATEEAALVTAVLATVATVINLISLVVHSVMTGKQRKSEEKRWYAQHFLTNRLAEIRRLQELVSEAYIALTTTRDPELEDLNHSYELLQRIACQYALASLYLDEDAKDSVSAAVVQFSRQMHTLIQTFRHQTGMASDTELPTDVPTLDELNDGHARVTGALGHYLTPEVVESYIDDLQEKGSTWRRTLRRWRKR